MCGFVRVHVRVCACACRVLSTGNHRLIVAHAYPFSLNTPSPNSFLTPYPSFLTPLRATA